MECREKGFKFKRSGMFGKGDYVDVYDREGEKIDRFELSNKYDDIKILGERQVIESFKNECSMWYLQYGYDLE